MKLEELRARFDTKTRSDPCVCCGRELVALDHFEEEQGNVCEDCMSGCSLNLQTQRWDHVFKHDPLDPDPKKNGRCDVCGHEAPKSRLFRLNAKPKAKRACVVCIRRIATEITTE